MPSDQSRTDTQFPSWLSDPRNAAAWKEFDDRYRPKIVGWCKGRGLQDADAEDITQQVILSIHTAIQKFTYDRSQGSFRGWLRKITDRACNTFFKRNPANRFQPILGHPPAREDLTNLINELAECELHQIALNTLKNNISSRDYKIFLSSVYDQATTSELVGIYNVSATVIYSAKYRAKELFRKICVELGASEGGA